MYNAMGSICNDFKSAISNASWSCNSNTNTKNRYIMPILRNTLLKMFQSGNCQPLV